MLDSQDTLSLVALVVSVVALIGAILQLLQQYYSSAEGYSNCGDVVMGAWAQTRKRKFRLTELRFEVQYETPVIFMCPPTNNKGPLGAKDQPRPLWHIQGTKASEDETRTPSVKTEEDERSRLRVSRKLNEDVHTADNERANWFILLQALHAMERDSLLWQQARLKEEQAELGPKAGMDLPSNVARWDQHTIVAALQPNRKSYDTMPSNVKKPYATSAICHMVEMVAMLGLHWRAFDRANHKYHAEGNGYLLTGNYVDDLGITFRLQVYGGTVFERQRVIPNDMIKLMAFGNVPTIHRRKDQGLPTNDNEDLRNAGIIQFGNTTELVESLTHYGCNSKTTNYFRDGKKKHVHLFPIVFEVLGMVAESFYIPNTYYRFLPNPTSFSWNRKNFSVRKLLREFVKAMQPDSEYITHTHHMVKLLDWGEELDAHLKDWADEDTFSITLLQSLHECIHNCDAYLVPPEKTLREQMVLMTKLVVREHVQEVMRLLNEINADDDSGDDSTLASREPPRQGGHHHAGKHRAGASSATFDELSSAAPEVRQGKLTEIYFALVRRTVAENVPRTLQKRSTGAYVPSVASRSNLLEASAEQDGACGASVVESRAAAGGPRSGGTPRMLLTSPSDEEEDGAGGYVRGRKSDVDEEGQLAEEIWCTLLFRMLCWLLLHDFHKKDVQISKSELFGSRLPVYVA